MKALSKIYGPILGKKAVIQPKLRINQPGDEYEQEADAMAEKVMSMESKLSDKISQTGLIGRSIQRKSLSGGKAASNNITHQNPKTESFASSSLVSTLNNSKSAGTTLPFQTKNFMENAFSSDFSNVRIHNDNRAIEMNKEINAKAFTIGNNIYFGAGEYAPNNNEGKKILAHELTHVIQQNNSLSEQKIQRVAPAFVGLAAAEWIAVGATGYVVASDAISASAGDVSYSFDEMEGVLLPGGGSDVSAYRTQNAGRQINEGTQYLSVYFNSNGFDKMMGIKFGITFDYDGLALGGISMNIVEVYDAKFWGGNVNVNLTPRNLSSGMSSVRLTINMGTNNSWFLPDIVGSGIFTLRADGDLSNLSSTSYFDYQIG